MASATVPMLSPPAAPAAVPPSVTMLSQRWTALCSALSEHGAAPGGGLRTPRRAAERKAAQKAEKAERRIGWDRKPRTLQEFIDHHGYAVAGGEWCRARPAAAPPAAPPGAVPVRRPFRAPAHYARSAAACSEAGSDASTHGVSDLSSRSSSCSESECDPPAPWLSGAADPQSVALGDEILSFAGWVSLTPSEAAARTSLRSALQLMAQQFWPAATVKLYGSVAYGLSLPSSSVDVVVEDCGADVAERLGAFFDHAGDSGYEVAHRSTGAAEGFAALRNVRAGLTANVTVLAGRSPERRSAAVVKGYLERFPAARAVLLVVRTVLAQSNLGAGTPGGIGPFALTVMVLHFFLARYSEEEAAEKDAGDALLDFLVYYGSEFDFKRQSVAVPALPTAPRVHAEGCISVCEPLDPARNVAAACTRLVQMKATFAHCRAALAQWGYRRGDSHGRTRLSSVVAVRSRQETGAARPLPGPPPHK